MDNQLVYLPNNNTLPWYDDRVKTASNATRRLGHNTSNICDTPKKIYGYLDKHVWKQDAAKRAAAILTYNSFFREVKENAMFVGPTGCGKTYIWRCLQELFPDKIEIVDGSNITADGWKGDKKWNSLLDSPSSVQEIQQSLLLTRQTKCWHRNTHQILRMSAKALQQKD